MAPDFAYYLVQYLSPSGLLYTMAAFILSFILWEAPKYLRLLDDEWLKGIYPEHGKLLDIAFLAVGVFSFIFMQLNIGSLSILPYKPGYDVLLSASLVALPIILALGFFGRVFSRMDAKHEVPSFFTHTVLDLVHTVFFICLLALVLPAAALLISPFM
jgi:hypothetical protein